MVVPHLPCPLQLTLVWLTHGKSFLLLVKHKKIPSTNMSSSLDVCLSVLWCGDEKTVYWKKAQSTECPCSAQWLSHGHIFSCTLAWKNNWCMLDVSIIGEEDHLAWGVSMDVSLIMCVLCMLWVTSMLFATNLQRVELPEPWVTCRKYSSAWEELHSTVLWLQLLLMVETGYLLALTLPSNTYTPAIICPFWAPV